MTLRTLSALTLALLLSSAGCAGDGEEALPRAARTATQPAQLPENKLVSERDVARHPGGSPERTVLRWWRAMQYGDPATAAELYRAAAGITARDVQDDLSQVAGFFRRTYPRIQETSRAGSRAIVYLVAETASEDKRGKPVQVTRPVALPLVRSSGQWRLANALFVEQLRREAR